MPTASRINRIKCPFPVQFLVEVTLSSEMAQRQRIREKPRNKGYCFHQYLKHNVYGIQFPESVYNVSKANLTSNQRFLKQQ